MECLAEFISIGELDGTRIAIKQLKSFSSRFAPSIIKRYEKLFTLLYNNIVTVLGVS